MANINPRDRLAFCKAFAASKPDDARHVRIGLWSFTKLDAILGNAFSDSAVKSKLLKAASAELILNSRP